MCWPLNMPSRPFPPQPYLSSIQLAEKGTVDSSEANSLKRFTANVTSVVHSISTEHEIRLVVR